MHIFVSGMPRCAPVRAYFVVPPGSDDNLCKGSSAHMTTDVDHALNPDTYDDGGAQKAFDVCARCQRHMWPIRCAFTRRVASASHHCSNVFRPKLIGKKHCVFRHSAYLCLATIIAAELHRLHVSRDEVWRSQMRSLLIQTYGYNPRRTAFTML